MTKDRLAQGVAYAAVEAGNFSIGQMLEHRNFQPLPVRFAKVGLGKALQRCVPLSIEVNSQQYTKLAAGGEQVVYTNGQEVLKFIHRSLTFDRDVAEAATSQHVQHYEAARLYMGDHITPTEFDIRKLRAGLFATVAIQPHITMKESFDNVYHLVGYSDKIEYISALEAFYDSLIRLYDQVGIQMDLNGPGNIALLDSQGLLLSMIDTLPVDTEKQKIEDPLHHTSLGDTLLKRMAVIGQAIHARTEWSESEVLALR